MQIFHYAIEVSSTDWQVAGTANHAGNISLSIAGTFEEFLCNASRHITNFQWRRGLSGRITSDQVLQHGGNRTPLAMTTLQ